MTVLTWLKMLDVAGITGTFRMIEEKWHFFVLGDKGRLSEKPSLARQGKDEKTQVRERFIS